MFFPLDYTYLIIGLLALENVLNQNVRFGRAFGDRWRAWRPLQADPVTRRVMAAIMTTHWSVIDVLLLTFLD